MIDTIDDIRGAATWLETQISIMADGGTWAIPRAATVYRIDKQNKTFWRAVGDGDSSTETVLKLMGWSVKTEAKNAGQTP